MGTEAAWVPLAVAALSAGGEYVNTQNTAKRQDQAEAQAIRNQSLIQRKADAKVNDTVQKLAGSTSADERAKRLDDYLGQLRRHQATIQAGLAPAIGSDAFKADSADAATGATNYADQTAGLLSRIDAPQLQRQGEGFDYGNLATDLNLLQRDSSGQNFLDQLRARNVRRNAKLDLLSGLGMAYAGSAYGGAGGATNGTGDLVKTTGGYTVNLPFRSS